MKHSNPYFLVTSLKSIIAPFAFVLTVVLTACGGDQSNEPTHNATGADINYQYAGASTTSISPIDIAVADLNNDGQHDMAGIARDGAIVVYIRQAGDQFEEHLLAEADFQLARVQISDINGDRHPDVAAMGGGFQWLIFLNDGQGTFTRADDALHVVEGARSLSVGDFDGESPDDLVISRDILVNVVLRSPQGEEINALYTQTNYSAHVADLNGDTLPDILLDLSDAVAVFEGNGDGSFTRGATTHGMPNYFKSFQTGHINDDERIDIAVFNSNVTVLSNTQDGTFNTQLDLI